MILWNVKLTYKTVQNIMNGIGKYFGKNKINCPFVQADI